MSLDDRNNYFVLLAHYQRVCRKGATPQGDILVALDSLWVRLTPEERLQVEPARDAVLSVATLPPLLRRRTEAQWLGLAFVAAVAFAAGLAGWVIRAWVWRCQ